MGHDSRKRPASDTRTTPLVLVGAPRVTSAAEAPLDRLVALTTLAAAITELSQEPTADPPRARVSSLADLAGEKAAAAARAFRLRRQDDEATANVTPPVTLRPSEPDE